MLTNLMKLVLKCTWLYINGLYFINLFELHLIDNHIVQRKLPSLRQLDKLCHFGFGLYNWAPVGQKGVQT